MCVSTKSANAAISVVMRDDVLVDSTDYRALISNDCRQSLLSILNVNIAVYILSEQFSVKSCSVLAVPSLPDLTLAQTLNISFFPVSEMLSWLSHLTGLSSHIFRSFPERMRALCVLVLLYLVNCSLGAVPSFGSCPNVRGKVCREL